MCLGGGSKGDGGAAQAAADEAARQAKIQEGTAAIDNAFSGFNDDYYNGIKTAYTSYAQPQLENQYAEAVKQLSYQLARKGLSASTAAGDAQKQLNEQYDKYRTDVLSGGQSYADKARSDIEDSRGNLVNQLVTTEDPAAAGENALRIAGAKTQPPAFDPIGNFVFNIAQGLQQQSDQNGGKSILSPTLFTPSASSSVSYVN